MAAKKPRIKDVLPPRTTANSYRIGFNVSAETGERFEQMAERLNVTNKDLFVAMVNLAYEDMK